MTGSTLILRTLSGVNYLGRFRVNCPGRADMGANQHGVVLIDNSLAITQGFSNPAQAPSYFCTNITDEMRSQTSK